MNVKSFFRRESPALLAGASVAGFIFGAITAVRATPRAMEELGRHRPYLPERGFELRKEQFKILFPIYAPAIAIFCVSTAASIAGVRVSATREVALVTAYTATHDMFLRWRDATREEVTQKKYRDIEARAATPDTSPSNSLLITSGDRVLCYDTWSKRYFYLNDVEDLKRAVNVINMRRFQDSFVPLNDFYELVGLEPVDYGITFGWNIGNDYIMDTLVDISINAVLTPRGDPCVSVTFTLLPEDSFDGHTKF